MTAPQSTPLPQPPQRNEPEAEFISKSNAWVAAQEQLRTELQAQADFVDVEVAGVDAAVIETNANAAEALASKNAAALSETSANTDSVTATNAAASAEAAKAAAINNANLADGSATDSANAAGAAQQANINANNSKIAAALSETNAATSEANALSSEQSAKISELLSLSAGNYVGVWSSLTGSVAAGVSVVHQNRYWGSIVAIADVALAEPSVSPDWLPVVGDIGTAASVNTGTAQNEIELNSQKTFKSFDSLTSAIAFVTANPDTIERVSTASYRNPAECAALGIDYPDGGGAEYVVVPSGTGTDDGGSFIDAGSKQLKVNVTDEIDVGVFGAYGVPNAQVNIAKCLQFAASRGLVTVASKPITVTAFGGGDGSQIYEQRNNYSISGGNIVNVSNLVTKKDSPREYKAKGDATIRSNNTLGRVTTVENTGSGGYGERINFHQNANSASFAIGHGVVSRSDGAGQSLASWLVQSSPTDPSLDGGYFCQEINPINVSYDAGYAKRRGHLDLWTSGIQAVPEGKDVTRQGSTDCFPTLFGFCTAHSKTSTSSGPQAKTYNGLMIERGSIADGGVGVQVAGTDTSDNSAGGDPEWPGIPNIGLRIEQKWVTGIDLTEGIFTDNKAINLASGHEISVGGNRVITDQQPAVSADATDLASALTLINELKARLKAHGLIAT